MDKFKNRFEDNGRAIVNIKGRTVFWYSFGSHAARISENPENYRYATPKETDILEVYRDRHPETYEVPLS